MCGICGKLSTVPGETIDNPLLERMNRALSHRGPDDQGTFLFRFPEERSAPTVGLGHCRLSILDLSQAGHQPMTNTRKTLWLTYNGEIYNFREIRKELEKKGRTFFSETDTEVILHLYEEKGVACLETFRGMFAFALWDSPRRRLFLARDRLGKKPLFYRWEKGTLWWSSSLEAMLQDPAIPRRVNPTALLLYLTYGYVPAPWTLFEGIWKLPPAHYLVWEENDIRITPYWHLSYEPKWGGSEAELSERLSGLLKEATRLRMISDVPLGAFLSGGIDSSTVVSFMAECSERPVKTFSIGFEEAPFNELPYAREVARHLGTDHHEFVVRPDAISVLPRLIQHVGEPFADSSILPTYYLSEMTRRLVKVALNGDAGDEIFAGYDRYRAQLVAQKARFFFRLFGTRGVSFLLSCFPDPEGRGFLKDAKRFARSCFLDREDRYIDWMSFFNRPMRESLIHERIREQVHHEEAPEAWMSRIYQKANGLDLLDATLRLDTLTYLPNDLLVKVDIASMAHALECRSPFLDHQVVEFMARVPSAFKMQGRHSKVLLKRTVSGRLPQKILRRPKQGFGVPVEQWFRGTLRGYAEELLLDPQTLHRGYFRQEALERILEEHFSRRRDHGGRLWMLICLELWHRIFIDGK